ncbi:MAG: endonuclease domain-containing protein [Lentimicrobium sp.]
MKWPEIKKIATRLRNNPTIEEEIMWKLLRKKQLQGRKFLRQHPIIFETNRDKNDFYFFIPDFYCAIEKLVIEIDGPIHDFQKEKDYKREEILISRGLHVLRFKNYELNNIDFVRNRVLSILRNG